MVSQRVEFAIWKMEQLSTLSAREEYVRSLPTGIRARVVGELLDRANGRRYMEKMHQELTDWLAKMAEAESKPYNPWVLHF